MIAKNIGELHLAKSNLTKETAVDEQVRLVIGRTEKNQTNTTYMLGHHDRIGLNNDSWATSWNSAIHHWDAIQTNRVKQAETGCSFVSQSNEFHRPF